MHKLPQPVKLWYLEHVLPPRAPAAGPLPAVLADRGGGDRLRRPGRRRRVDPAARRDARGDRRARAAAAALQPRHARHARRLPRGAAGVPARATRTGSRQEVRDRIDLNPLRAFDANHPGTQRVMASAPRLLDRLPHEDLEHFAEVQELLDAAGLAYEVDTTLVRGLDYYTRTVFEFTSDALGAQTRRRRRRPLRRPDRADRRPAHARHGLGRGRRADAALLASAAGRAAAASTSTSPTPSPSTSAAAFRLAADARRAGPRRKTRTRAAAASRASSSRPIAQRRPLRCHLRRRGYGR